MHIIATLEHRGRFYIAIISPSLYNECRKMSIYARKYGKKIGFWLHFSLLFDIIKVIHTKGEFYEKTPISNRLESA